jgi:hypothetical protein
LHLVYGLLPILDRNHCVAFKLKQRADELEERRLIISKKDGCFSLSYGFCSFLAVGLSGRRPYAPFRKPKAKLSHE